MMTFSAHYYKYIVGPNIIGYNLNSVNQRNYYLQTLLANRSEILCILPLPFQTWCFLFALQRVKLRRIDKVPTHPGRFLFLSLSFFHRWIEGQRATLGTGFSCRHETRADASRPGSDVYTSLFSPLSIKYTCYPETSLCLQMTISNFVQKAETSPALKMQSGQCKFSLYFISH